MKQHIKNICLLLTFSGALTVQAQKHFSYIEEYRFAERKGEEKMVILTMPIGRSEIISFTGDTAALRFAGPLIIDVVCTDYPSNAPLTALNQKRIEALYNTFSFLKNSRLHQVNFFRQLKGNTSTTAAKMFHGLVIKFRLAQTPGTIEHDLDKLDQLLASALPPEIEGSEETEEVTPATDEYGTIESYRPGTKISSNNAVTVYQDGNYVIVDPRQAVPEMQKQGLLKTDSIKWIRGREIYSYFKPGTPYAEFLQKKMWRYH